jgi:maltose alpha-D-glucosyltransferase / alpha-amylase
MQAQQENESKALWYKDAIIYEVPVKAFYDSDGDGVGDFRGLTSKLDYLADLGVTAVWLLPFYKSPLKDDGYDVSDHLAVQPELGDLEDFRKFIKEGHRRGLKVITELVLNHTSSQHSWFQRARKSPPGSTWREYYTWSDTTDKFREARVIFSDFESSNWSWDPVAKAYYWHRFYSHQPDLNYDNSTVQEEAFRIVEFWLKLGVDGLRLDGIPYLFEREGTNCENLPQTHEFLRKLRSRVDSKFRDRMLLAEANQWPADAVAYFGGGDECHMAFHFPLMPRMFMAIQLEDKTPITDIMVSTPPIPETCQWALFLRNHDEFTLEMVTDEERDYLFKAYAKDTTAKINLGIRRRFAPLLENDRRKIELMELLLFTLPGTPVIYYGDEILMGDNYNLGDRNSMRTPMQWDATLNAGFSRTNPQRLYLPLVTDAEFHYETVNVENQERNPTSHLWWLKKLIAVRKSLKSLARGGLEFVESGNSKVLAFVRTSGKEAVLVAVNLSRYPQVAELNLSSFEGRNPVDVFGLTRFPPLARSPYPLTFGPRGYYVFGISPAEAQEPKTAEVLPVLHLRKGFREVGRGEAREILESKILPVYLSGQPWFKDKTRAPEVVKIRDIIPIDGEASPRFQIVLADAYYREGMPETYVLPLAYAPSEYATKVVASFPRSAVASAVVKEEKGVIYDGVADDEFRPALLRMLGKSVKGGRGELRFSAREKVEAPLARGESHDASELPDWENGSWLRLDGGLMLKIIRNPEEGTNPELELGEMLTTKSFPNTWRILGDLTYTERGAGPLTIGILQEYTAGATNLWDLCLDEAGRFLEDAGARTEGIPRPLLDSTILELSRSDLPSSVAGMIGSSQLERMRNLGRITAAFHRALGDSDHEGFSLKPFGYLYQVSAAYALTTGARKVLRRARESAGFAEGVERDLEEIAGSEDRIVEMLKLLRLAKIDSVRIRIHGEYQLRNILLAGENTIITNCESVDTEPMDDRRILRSPLKDVVQMTRSLQYVAHEGFLKASKESSRGTQLLSWSYLWYKACSATFLGGYLERVKGSRLVPSDDETLTLLFNTYLLDECLGELEKSLDSHSDLVTVPIRPMMELLAA